MDVNSDGNLGLIGEAYEVEIGKGTGREGPDEYTGGTCSVVPNIVLENTLFFI
jgi:hypothetical protein